MTRTPTPTRPTSYSPRRSSTRSHASRPRRSALKFKVNFSRIASLVARPLIYLLVVAAAVATAAAFLLIAVPLVVHSILSLLGIGTAFLLPGLLATTWRWRSLGASVFFKSHWRDLSGGLFLWTGALSLTSLLRPAELVIWGVEWSEASIGGLLGQFVHGPDAGEGLLRTFGLLLAGTALVVRPTLRLTWRAIGVAWAFIVSLHLPQRGAVLGLRGASIVWKSILVLYRRARGHATTPSRTDEPAFDLDEDAPYQDQISSTGTLPRFDENGEFQRTAPPMSSAIQSTLLPIVESDAEAQEDEEAALSAPASTRWQQPGLDLLETVPEPAPADQAQRAKQIEEALASYGVEGKVVQIHVGPAVTQFGVEPGWIRKYREVRERDKDGKTLLDKDGNPRAHQEELSRTRVKVERIAGLSNNLALALSAPSVRIEAPVPGKNIVGIEVPNAVPSLVTLRSVIETPAFQRLRPKSKLALALGKGVSGDPVVADLTKMPHLLIAGATGSGKSVCINSIVCGILMHASPDDVRFLMIDPKRVELVPYNAIPHLLAPVIVDADKVVGTLNWVIKEMDGRYRKFAAVGVRNIEGYNKSAKATEQLPFWVLIIDELADLMMVAPYEVERGLCRLAQLARATGIHLIVATQRPSVDVVTGLIKANFPTRISFAVTSHVDSRTILDASGAEKLLGRGDMLFMATDAAKPKRVQGTYLSDVEVERLVEFWGDDRFRYIRPRQFAEEMELAAAATKPSGDDEDDALMERARQLAETSERVSTSFLQRRLRIGYPRAARLMEALRDEGYGNDSPFADDDF